MISLPNTFLAGLALTMINLPNTSFLPALVAGFIRVFIMHSPGMVNLPVPLTSFVPTAVRLSNAALQSLGFRPVAVAMAFTIPDFDMAAALFIPAAFIAGAISVEASYQQEPQ